MKILHMLKNDPDMTTKEIIEEHEKSGEVTTIDLRINKNYSEIVDIIEASDRIICW